jgi:hypothetical protein
MILSCVVVTKHEHARLLVSDAFVCIVKSLLAPNGVCVCDVSYSLCQHSFTTDKERRTERSAYISNIYFLTVTIINGYVA